MVIFTKKFLTKVAIFCCFGVFSLRPSHIFQVQAKISTVRPVFPDCISVSSGCDERYTEQGRQHNIEEIGLSKASLKTADAINQVFFCIQMLFGGSKVSIDMSLYSSV